jgi:hypothetical protein
MSSAYNQRKPMPKGMETIEFSVKREKTRKARRQAKVSKRKNRK